MVPGGPITLEVDVKTFGIVLATLMITSFALVLVGVKGASMFETFIFSGVFYSIIKREME